MVEQLTLNQRVLGSSPSASTTFSHRLAAGGRGWHPLPVDMHSVRAALARRFLRRLKRATHRAPAKLIVPRAERVLVVAPHMDDEVIPCGGTLMLLIAGGAEVHVAFATDGSSGVREPSVAASLSAIRREEAGQARDFLGLSETIEFGFPDGRLHAHEPALADSIAEQILRINPNLLFTPFPGDGHADHMACAWATARAAVRCKWSGTILAYEVWTALWPNVAVDITPVAERKAEAIRLYASQVADRDYAAAALGLNSFRGQAHAVPYAEAFHRDDAAGFERLTALLDEF